MEEQMPEWAKMMVVYGLLSAPVFAFLCGFWAGVKAFRGWMVVQGLAVWTVNPVTGARKLLFWNRTLNKFEGE